MPIFNLYDVIHAASVAIGAELTIGEAGGAVEIWGVTPAGEAVSIGADNDPFTPDDDNDVTVSDRFIVSVSLGGADAYLDGVTDVRVESRPDLESLAAVITQTLAWAREGMTDADRNA